MAKTTHICCQTAKAVYVVDFLVVSDFQFEEVGPQDVFAWESQIPFVIVVDALFEVGNVVEMPFPEGQRDVVDSVLEFVHYVTLSEQGEGFVPEHKSVVLFFIGGRAADDGHAVVSVAEMCENGVQGDAGGLVFVHFVEHAREGDAFPRMKRPRLQSGCSDR